MPFAKKTPATAPSVTGGSLPAVTVTGAATGVPGATGPGQSATLPETPGSGRGRVYDAGRAESGSGADHARGR